MPKQPELKWKEGVGSGWIGWMSGFGFCSSRAPYSKDLQRENRAAATDFARERIVRRYNPALNALLEFWSMLFASPQRDLPALGISTGVNAAFRLGDVTAFSGEPSMSSEISPHLFFPKPSSRFIQTRVGRGSPSFAWTAAVRAPIHPVLFRIPSGSRRSHRHGRETDSTAS